MNIALPLSTFFIALAALTRQQGIIVLIGALIMVLLPHPAAHPSLRRFASRIWVAGWFTCLFVLMMAGLNFAILRTALQGPADGMAFGTKILEFYDLSGTFYHDRSVRFDMLKAHGVDVEHLEDYMLQSYGADRWDHLATIDPVFAGSITGLPLRTMTGQWIATVLGHPGGYLAHRFEVFKFLLGFGIRDECVYVHPLGVPTDPASAQLVGELNLSPGYSPRLQPLLELAWPMRNTFLYFPGFYLVIDLILLIVAIRSPLYLFVLPINVCATLYTFSFFFLSIACDFRYLYFLSASQALSVFALSLQGAARGNVSTSHA